MPGQWQLFYNSMHDRYFPAFLQRVLRTARSLEPTQDSLTDEPQSHTQAAIHSFYDAPSFLSFIRWLFRSAKKSEAKVSAGESTLNTPATIHTLPNELLLHIFSFLELRPYIFAHGVCTDWKHLLPFTDMHPTRRRLLDLYNRILQTPKFEKSLVWSLENLLPFDRKKYIDSLLAQYPAIPEQFEMWIMEWPERLVIGCLWPGLPFVYYQHPPAKPTVDRVYGVNWLSNRPASPNLVAPMYKPPVLATSYERVPALLLWRHDALATYLVFDRSNTSIFGRVFVVGFDEDEGSDVIPNGRPPFESDDESNDEFDDEFDDDFDPPGYSMDGDYDIGRPFADWICFLEVRWRDVCYDILHFPEVGPTHNKVMKEHVRYLPGGGNMHECSALLWDPARM